MTPEGLEVVNITIEKEVYENLLNSGDLGSHVLNSVYIQGESYPDDPEWAQAHEARMTLGRGEEGKKNGYWHWREKEINRAYELRNGIKTHGIADQLKKHKDY